MRTRIYLHPLCSSSAKVFMRLKEDGLLGNVSIIPLEPAHELLTDRLVPSVPALEIGGEIVAVDPLEPDFVVSVVRENLAKAAAYVPKGVDEAVERFTKSFIYSSYLMVLEFVSGVAIKSAIEGGFAKAAVRAWFMPEDTAEYILKALPKKVDEVREGIYRYLDRVVAYNYLREALMVFGEDGLDQALVPETALLWLQAKASVGRAHLFGTPLKAVEAVSKAERLVQVIKERKSRWVPRLMKEFEELKDFARELSEATAPRSPY